MISSTSRTAAPGRLGWGRRLLLLGMAMTVATATFVLTADAEAEAAPSGRPLGVDVSVYQHPNGQAIDWKAVKRYGVRFAIVKATEGPKSGGSYYTNSWFKKDWNGAISAGIATGAYHYSRPRLPIWTAAQDARHFVNTVGRVGAGGMPPVLDLEESGGLSSANLVAWAQTWLNEVQRLTGQQPMIYSALWFWNSYMGGTTKLSSYPLWIASYASSPGLMPGGWGGWNAWQYTGSGRVPGIPAPVDINVACGGKYLLGWCGAQKYSTWATAYYNRKWQQSQQSKQTASAVGGAAKPTPPTTAKSSTSSSTSKGTSSKGTSSTSGTSSSTGKGTSSTSKGSSSGTSSSSSSSSKSSGTSSTGAKSSSSSTGAKSSTSGSSGTKSSSTTGTK